MTLRTVTPRSMNQLLARFMKPIAVDEGVLVPTLACGVEVALLLLLLPLLRNRNGDERLACATAREEYAGRAVRPDLEVVLGCVVRRADDRVARLSAAVIDMTLCRESAYTAVVLRLMRRHVLRASSSS